MYNKDLLSGKKVMITSDLYDICNRLKEIDNGYYVVFDRIKQKYEVWHQSNLGGVPDVTVPYDELDCRTVSHVNMTRVENIDKLASWIM